MTLRTLKLGFKVAPVVAWAELTWLHRWARHPEKVPLEKRYKKVRKFIRRVINLLELDIKFNNVNLLNNQNKCFLGLSNHRHYIDPLLYIYYSEKPISFVSKKENKKLPLVKDVLSVLEVEFIDRDDVLTQVKIFKKIASRIKNNELTYFIFPEGTRMKNHEQIHTLPYKEGAIKPAYWAETDIIPCVSYGTDYLTKKRHPELKKRNVTVEAIKIYQYEKIKDIKTMDLMPQIEKESNDKIKQLVKECLSRNRRKQ